MLNKVGPHLIDPSSIAIDWLRSTNAVKVLDRPYLLKDARPGAITVYRKYFPKQDLNRHGADVAIDAINDCRAQGVVPTFIELYCEVGQTILEELRAYVRFTTEALPVIRAYGSELAAFSFSTGTPSEEGWRLLKELKYGGVKVIALHEYWGNEGFTLWNALRHRTIHEWTSGDHPLFIITECGRDKIEGGNGGWLRDNISVATYKSEVQQYNDEIEKDGYVISAHLFTANGIDTWAPYTTDPLCPFETQERNLWPINGSVEENKMTLALALVPSNQEYNVGVIPGYNERGGMAYLMNQMLPFCQQKGINAKGFAALADAPTSVEKIRQAYINARAWLDLQPDARKLCLSMHTDSSGAVGSHTAYCYGVATGQAREQSPSYIWGKLLAGRIQLILKTKFILSFNYSDYLFYTILKPYTSLLMEICAHDNIDDLNALYANSQAVSEALITGTLDWAGVSSGTPDMSEVDRLNKIISEAKAILNKA